MHAVERRGVEGAAAAGGGVVLVQRAYRLGAVDVELLDERLQRVGLVRLARLVTRLEELQHLAVEDLIDDALRLLEDETPVLGVGERVEIGAFVDPALPL